jgi:hypothetical protein
MDNEKNISKLSIDIKTMTNDEIKARIDYNTKNEKIIAHINFIDVVNNALNNPLTIIQLNILLSIENDIIKSLINNSNSNIYNLFTIKNLTSDKNNDNTFNIVYDIYRNYYIYYDNNNNVIKILSYLKNDDYDNCIKCLIRNA